MVDVIKSVTLAILFKQGKMKGSDLIRNLHWLGQSGGLMTLMDESEDELNSKNDDSEQNDDNNELIGRGLVVNSKKGDVVKATASTSLRRSVTSNARNGKHTGKLDITRSKFRKHVKKL